MRNPTCPHCKSDKTCKAGFQPFIYEPVCCMSCGRDFTVIVGKPDFSHDRTGKALVEFCLSMQEGQLQNGGMPQ